jgi:transposase
MAEKMAIVAESLAPGAVASEIALRYGLHRNQLYGWRREFRAAVAADAGALGSDFVPIVAENRIGSNAPTIEIEIGGAIVRVAPGVDPAFLSEVILLLKAAA